MIDEHGIERRYAERRTKFPREVLLRMPAALGAEVSELASLLGLSEAETLRRAIGEGSLALRAKHLQEADHAA